MSGPGRGAAGLYHDRASRLCELVSAFDGVPVLVLADLCLDEFLYAEISRVSREAPVLIVEHRRLEAMPGGGANAVHNIRTLGGRPVPVGVVGDDEAGRRLLALLREAGVATDGIRVEERYATPVKTRVLAALPHSRPQQVVRIDKGAIHSVEAAAARAGAERAMELLPGASALLLSDYSYDFVRPDLASPLVDAARQRRIPVTSDSRKRGREFTGVTAATPNLEEAEEILGWPLAEEGARLREAGERLRTTLRADNILITRGGKGMLLFEAGRPPAEVPVFGTDEVADVTGAGDTVIAAFTLALASGASPLEAALLANAAAGLVVMKRGTATITPCELTSALRSASSARE